MSGFLRTTILAGITLAGLSASAMAEATTFDYPKHKGLALDWCRSWATDCGKPAADTWCQKKGFDSAAGFSKWNDAGEPTRVISSNQICDDASCDSFTKISCQKADDYTDEDPEPVRYNLPTAGKRRLDWCLTWATNCGKPAADFYCKAKGHAQAAGFKIDENIWKTRIMKTGQKCTEPECDGFKYIDCE
jgi:hypothetical protein